jgi:DNA repair protein RadD
VSEFGDRVEFAARSILDAKKPPRELRDYQKEAIEGLRASLRAGHRRPVLQAPTGYGKTVLASHVLRLARMKGRRVVFCVPALSLIDQTLLSFWSDGLADIGVIQADHPETDWSRPIQIASVQTLLRRPYPEAQLVIIDECHRWYDFYGKWMADPAWATVPFIGLSATPWTKNLGKHFDDLVISATTQELILRGHLSPFRVFAAGHPDLTGVRIVAGDYHEGQLSDAMNQSQLNGNVVLTWQKLAEGRPTLVFGVDCAHAQALQMDFRRAGIPAGYQDADTDKKERSLIKRAFHDGSMPVVCNVGTLTTGVDWDVRCISLVRPTKSEMLYVQIIGRGLRTAPGKTDCLILDHSDTTLRLGFVTDIHHTELDVAGPKKAEPSPQWENEDGFIRKRSLQVDPGAELHELKTAGGICRVGMGEIEISGSRLRLEDFHSQLVGYACVRGYKPGWASHKYREAVGTWPPSRNPEPANFVAAPVARWLKSRQIAWARRRS